MFCPFVLGTVGMIAASMPAAASTTPAAPQADQPQSTVQATRGALVLAPSSGKDHYAGLFEPRQAVDRPHTVERVTAGIVAQRKPKVVCGMVIFDADPAFDARIRIPIPNANVQHAIRRIPAPACR